MVTTFSTNVPQKHHLAAPRYLQFSWDTADREVPKSLFYDRVLKLLYAPACDRSHVQLHKQACILLNESAITQLCQNESSQNPTQPILVWNHRTLTSKSLPEGRGHRTCDHPRSLTSSPLVEFLTLAMSLASLTHSLTLDCGSLHSHAWSTGRKMKTCRWLCATCCAKSSSCYSIPASSS